jgi:hypothetical protein
VEVRWVCRESTEPGHIPPNGLNNFQRVGTDGGKFAFVSKTINFVPVLLALPYKLDPDLGILQIGDRKDRVSYQVDGRTQRAMKKRQRKHKETTEDSVES